MELSKLEFLDSSINILGNHILLSHFEVNNSDYSFY